MLIYIDCEPQVQKKPMMKHYLKDVHVHIRGHTQFSLF